MPHSVDPSLVGVSTSSTKRSRFRDFQRLLSFVRPYAGLSISALILLGALVMLDLAIPRLIQRVIDQGIAHHDGSVVIHSALLMLGISGLSVVFAVANNIVSVKVGEGVARDLRDAIFVKIQGFSFARLDEQKTGELLVRLTSDVNAVKFLTLISLRIGTRAPLLMIGSLILMVDTSRQLAIMLLPLLIITILLIVFFVANMEPLFLSVQRKLDEVNEVIHENVAGARLIKGLVRAEHECQRFGKVNEEMTQRSIRVMRLMSWMTPSLALCINLGVVLVIWRGGYQSIQGQLSLGQIVAFSNYLMTTMTPLVMMTMLSNTWAAGFASLERLQPILVDQLGQHAPSTAADPSLTSIYTGPVVRFEHVCFRYNLENSEGVLRDVSFVAQPGQTLAILGSTGAGKSTLVNLVAGFYRPSEGQIEVFGQNVQCCDAKLLLKRIGLVPQEAILFSGTIRDNIRYGRPEATENEVIAAAQAAQADEFISRLPDAYDSRVEQRGNNFSGGQKQRISIARALLTNPELLILDDSTSAVDVETETKIQRALLKREGLRTTIVVAQRVSTVLDADLILVIEKGTIAASGTHSQLLENSPIYREIYDSQLGTSP
jgi:ATP-binding cassette, subfamily B, multidrug efflux pump